MGHQTFSMNFAVSARRFSRLRENIRNSASRVMIPATVPMMLYASGTFSRRKMLMISSTRAVQTMVSVSRSTPLRPYMKRDSALPIRCKKFIKPSLCLPRPHRRFSDKIFYRKSQQR